MGKNCCAESDACFNDPSGACTADFSTCLYDAEQFGLHEKRREGRGDVELRDRELRVGDDLRLREQPRGQAAGGAGGSN